MVDFTLHMKCFTLKLSSVVQGSYPQSLPRPCVFIYIHPFNACAGTTDDTMYVLSFTTLGIWLISVLSLGVDPVFEFCLLKCTGCQPDGPLPPTPPTFIRQLPKIKDTCSSVNMLANFFYFLFCLAFEWTLVAYIYLRDSNTLLGISSHM